MVATLHPAKKLRSVQPDLQVVVGTGDQTTTYHYHSLVLASYSSYIDTLLADEWNIGNSTSETTNETKVTAHQGRTIRFPDIDPPTWEFLLRAYVEDGFEDISLRDATRLLPLYDKYDFADAMKQLDRVLASQLNPAPEWTSRIRRFLHFHGNEREPNPPTIHHHPVAQLVGYVALCHNKTNSYPLPQTKKQCILVLEHILNDKEARLGIFALHWFGLAQLVADEEPLWEIVAEHLGTSTTGVSKKQFADTTGEGAWVRFRLLRALLERDYVKSIGIRFPGSP